MQILTEAFRVWGAALFLWTLHWLTSGVNLSGFLLLLWSWHCVNTLRLHGYVYIYKVYIIICWIDYCSFPTLTSAYDFLAWLLAQIGSGCELIMYVWQQALYAIFQEHEHDPDDPYTSFHQPANDLHQTLSSDQHHTQTHSAQKLSQTKSSVTTDCCLPHR